jgi:hypothetical protein
VFSLLDLWRALDCARAANEFEAERIAQNWIKSPAAKEDVELKHFALNQGAVNLRPASSSLPWTWAAERIRFTKLAA